MQNASRWHFNTVAKGPHGGDVVLVIVVAPYRALNGCGKMQIAKMCPPRFFEMFGFLMIAKSI
jgi:hypothetical protein